MAGSLNRVTLIGHLGADPEMRRTNDGRPIANFRIATSESWRDKNSGERRENTEWHNVVVFAEGLAKLVEQYVKKGSKILVEGQMKTRKWQDKEGNDRYSTEVVLQAFNGTILLLDGRDSNGGGGGGRRDDDDRGSRSPSRSNDRRDDRRDDRGRDDDRRGSGGGGSYHSDMDDEVPF